MNVGNNAIGAWLKFSNGILIQFGHIPYKEGELIEVEFNLPISFKDTQYAITQGIWATAGSVFHISPYTANKYRIDFKSFNGQIAKHLYSESSFIAIGFWK